MTSPASFGTPSFEGDTPREAVDRFYEPCDEMELCQEMHQR